MTAQIATTSEKAIQQQVQICSRCLSPIFFGMIEDGPIMFDLEPAESPFSICAWTSQWIVMQRVEDDVFMTDQEKKTEPRYKAHVCGER
jgi:hypothetical protein